MSRATVLRQPFAVPPPFEAIDDVVAGLAALEVALASARDLRGVFVMTYSVSTTTIQRWIDQGSFLDNQMMARLVVTFGNAFRSALEAYGAGERARVSVAWQQTFDACTSRSGTAFQCLMLAINAHINRDLPYAVINAGVDVDCTRRYSDFARFDDVMRLSLPVARRRLAHAYWRDVPFGQRLFGGGMEALTARGVEQARRNAWTLARLLARADTAAERARVEQLIERRAARAGEAILSCRNPASWIAAITLPVTSDGVMSA